MSALPSPPQVVQPEDSSEQPLTSERTESNEGADTEQGETNVKKNIDGKRRLFGLLKKKDSDKSGKMGEALSPEKAASTASAPKSMPMAVTPQKTPPRDGRQLPGSPQSNISAAASPTRRFRSPSPGLHSPASSLIFERNVQEQPLPDELASNIPHHIQTEDHIPPVLEASSLAITDGHLNPDEVEIVMHSAHQPAGTTVPAHPEMGSSALSPTSMFEDAAASSSALHEMDGTASNYGSHTDAVDIRRLSFISFADVVQSEHVDHNNELMHGSFSSAANRSPSPIRSPASSHGFGPSPPTSGAPSVKGFDIAMASRLPGSPISHGTQSPPLGGDLMVETMRQAVRKTASGDLSGARSPASPSQPLSAMSLDDAHPDQHSFHRLQ